MSARQFWWKERTVSRINQSLGGADETHQSSEGNRRKSFGRVRLQMGPDQREAGRETCSRASSDGDVWSGSSTSRDQRGQARFGKDSMTRQWRYPDSRGHL